MSYYEYNDEFDYNSDEWKQDRKDYLENEWEGECEKCNSPTLSPHVHHIYGTGEKHEEMLERGYKVYRALCPHCHSIHHNKKEIRKIRGDYFFTNCNKCNKRIVMKLDWDKNWNKCEEEEIKYQSIEEIERNEGIITEPHDCHYERIEKIKIITKLKEEKEKYEDKYMLESLKIINDNYLEPIYQIYLQELISADDECEIVEFLQDHPNLTRNDVEMI